MWGHLIPGTACHGYERFGVTEEFIGGRQALMEKELLRNWMTIGITWSKTKGRNWTER